MKVAWVDAHADINTENTSPSGNIHGMPVAIFAGLSQNLGNKFKCLDLSSELQYIGVRDCDPGEISAIDCLSIPIHDNLDSEL
jgi:arginase